MSEDSSAPKHPFRVTRSAQRGGPPLTVRQKQTLAAVDFLCPTSGSECDARAVASATGVRLGSIVVILHSLVDKRLVTRIEEGDGSFWAPTMTGRARVRHFPAEITNAIPNRPALKPAAR